MYQAQLITSAIEFAINKALSFDEESHVLLQPLAGKQCEIKLHELPFPLVFNFHANGVVLNSIVADGSASQKNQDQCAISLSVFIINELKDTSNITRLIREEKLDFDGNLQIAQNMSALFDGLDIDVEEILSQYIGDIAAHHTFQTVASFGQFMKRKHAIAMQALSETLLDKKPVGVRANEVDNHIQEVSNLRNAVARLEARLTILESKTKTPHSAQASNSSNDVHKSTIKQER
jgi:ubiquinone biosynthesis protein UbiJ